MYKSSPHPSLFVNLDIVRSNIRKMYQKSREANVEFRPHFKTHQSLFIGRLFREHDVSAITVSSLNMANYFASDGWKDITIAFPINILATKEYDALANETDLKTLVISSESVRALDKGLTNNVGLYIEIDPAYGRSGIPAGNLEEIDAVVKAIEQSTHCYHAGFYCHAGHSYQARSETEVNDIAQNALAQLEQINKKYPDTDICYGDTPSCSILNSFGPATQISPGNFVFYDWMQVQIGSCTLNEIAVYMECPVIEKFETRQELLIHGGAVHFSKDSLNVNTQPVYGQIITEEPESNYISKLSQEHGLVHCSQRLYNKIKIGDKLRIYPIHSCLTADCMGTYHTTTEGEQPDHIRGKK